MQRTMDWAEVAKIDDKVAAVKAEVAAAVKTEVAKIDDKVAALDEKMEQLLRAVQLLSPPQAQVQLQQPAQAPPPDPAAAESPAPSCQEKRGWLGGCSSVDRFALPPAAQPCKPKLLSLTFGLRSAWCPQRMMNLRNLRCAFLCSRPVLRSLGATA